MPTSPPPARRGVVAIVIRDNQLLVIRRSQYVRAPGMFCFPGGGVEAGETEHQALVREVQEELGVTVVPRHRLWKCTSPTRVHLSWWLADLESDQPLVPNPAEVAQALWLPPDQLERLEPLLATNHQFLKAWQAGQFDLPLPRLTDPM